MELTLITIKVERNNGFVSRRVTVQADDSEGKVIIDDVVTEDALNIQDTKLNCFQRWIEGNLSKTKSRERKI